MLSVDAHIMYQFLTWFEIAHRNWLIVYDRKNIGINLAAPVSWFIYCAEPHRKSQGGWIDSVPERPGHIIDHAVYALYSGDDLIGLFGTILSCFSAWPAKQVGRRLRNTLEEKMVKKQKKIILDEYEKEILEAYENGRMKPSKAQADFPTIAKNTLKKTARSI